jgi:hypothetical protein
MKFIDNANKPIQKIAKKTTTKLSSFKKDIVKKVTKDTPIITPPSSIKANNIKKTAKNISVTAK